MSKANSTRSGCKDVFHAFLVKNATYDSSLEIPCLKSELRKLKKIIAFSKAIRSTDYGAWVHFYEDDVAFERLWNRPKTYLPILKRFKGVISPDFSIYRDMPLVMQQWNIYRGRAIAHWLQKNDVPVISNIRFGDERIRTHYHCCLRCNTGLHICQVRGYGHRDTAIRQRIYAKSKGGGRLMGAGFYGGFGSTHGTGENHKDYIENMLPKGSPIKTPSSATVKEEQKNG